MVAFSPALSLPPGRAYVPVSLCAFSPVALTRPLPISDMDGQHTFHHHARMSQN